MTETKARRLASRSRRWLVVAIAMVLLLLVVRGVLDLWAASRIKATLWSLEQKHGSLDLATLAIEPVQPSDNRARGMREAARLIAYSPQSDWSDYQSSLSSFLKQPVPATLPADLRAFAEGNGEALRVAGDARLKAKSAWEADYLADTNVPRWSELRALSYTIYLAAMLDLERGRADDAARTIGTGLALSASVRQEPSLIAQLIRLAFSLQHFEAAQRLLAQSEPSKAALEELALRLSENRSPEPMHVGVLSELKFFNSKMSQFVSGEGLFSLLLTESQSSRLRGRPFDWVGRPWVRLKWAECLEQMGQLIDVQMGPRPRPELGPPPQSVFCPGGAMRRSMETGDLFNSERGLTEVAVALRRYRLEHGQYPDAIAALVPSYLPSVPIDPFTGKPHTYERQGAGFRLHGENGTKSQGPTVAALDWKIER